MKKLSLAICLLLNINHAIRLKDIEDSIEEVDDSGLTSLTSLSNKSKKLADKNEVQT